MSKFHHYDKNSVPVCLDLTTRPVVDRIATRNTRTKYKADGIGLGAYVTGRGRFQPWGGYVQVTEPAQVWCASDYGKGYWWVATGRDFVLMHESSMILVGHADQDAPLEAVAS